MTDQTVTPDAEAEWLARFKAALESGPKISEKDTAAVTPELSLSSVMRYSGLSHLRLYWISLELFEEAKRLQCWPPQLLSDLSCIDWLIANIEGKKPASQRALPDRP
jgi:hypothetical protein